MIGGSPADVKGIHVDIMFEEAIRSQTLALFSVTAILGNFNNLNFHFILVPSGVIANYHNISGLVTGGN